MRKQLMLAFILLIVITLMGVALYARANATTQIHQFLGRGGALGTADLIEELEAYYVEHGWVGVEQVMSPGGPGRGAGNQSGRNIRLADPEGNLLYAPSGALSSDPVSSETLSNGTPLLVDSSIVGYLLTAQDSAITGIDFENSLIKLLDQALLRAAILSGAAGILMAVIIASALIRPLRNLSDAAVELSHGNLNQRVIETGPPEIKALGQSFNHMAASLQRLESNRRAMTADIAHELRTPLSIQRINLEAMQDGVYPLDQANLQVIVQQNQLLTRLVDDLRTLSLADAGQLELEPVDVDLNAFVQQFYEQSLADARERNILLDLSLPAEAIIAHVDPLRISQILSNLVQNALRFTPQGGTIAIRLHPDQHSATIAIQDDGPGIPKQALPHLFERFYKAEQSRRDSGTGLGLAIARRLAELHEGTLEAANAADRGAVFTLRIPRI
ncbi:MAG: HAMP domain-containing protein [Anaerolineales bacterium]|nr:HAMP domain-containing protein [Anaerolineales bacterium]